MDTEPMIPVPSPIETEPWTRETAVESLERRTRRTALAAEGDVLGPAVERLDTGTVIGEVILRWTSEQHQQAEIGFALHPDHHRQGFGREAATAMLRFGFETFGLGMRHEALLVENHIIKGAWVTEDIYALRAERWLALLNHTRPASCTRRAS